MECILLEVVSSIAAPRSSRKRPSGHHGPAAEAPPPPSAVVPLLFCRNVREREFDLSSRTYQVLVPVAVRYPGTRGSAAGIIRF